MEPKSDENASEPMASAVVVQSAVPDAQISRIRYIACMFVSRILGLLGESRRLIGWSVFFGLLFTVLGSLPPRLVRQMIRWLEPGVVAGSFLVLGLILADIYLRRGATRYLYGLTSHVA